MFCHTYFLRNLPFEYFHLYKKNEKNDNKIPCVWTAVSRADSPRNNNPYSDFHRNGTVVAVCCQKQQPTKREREKKEEEQTGKSSRFLSNQKKRGKREKVEKQE